MTSATAIISSGTHTTLSKSSLTTKRSPLDPCSRLTFTAHLPKSRFSLLGTHSKSIRATPVKASAAAVSDSIYVNTESFYDLLGISETGTVSEIKKAYKQLARKYHPDVSPPGKTEEYTKRFIQVQEAYETLSDPERRALYDRDMSRGGLGLHTIFSAGKRNRSSLYREEDRFEWEQRWQSQLAELIRRSNSSSSRSNDLGNMSWGARMRKQRSYSN
ncbi:chaperone protein DNAj, putative [Ricinus communis]|uniref:Chaperone protein DNAj, putative n=1 Tax=Ricinus communis TaxID=3988 RepID=B9SYM0_RICCO|nr:chaperone protein DNAj, putative [Ricinus communis]|eukprot:XP_002531089.1 chaperone protein dnaJ 20, chloroplastic [Ricinus communis]